MIRAIASFVLLTLADGYRLESNELQHSDVKSKFFENCEELQGLFHGRVSAVQNLLAAHPDATGFSKIDQARFTMRTFAVVRTLRRAKDCEWVVDGASEEVQAAQAIVQVTVAGNPCAAAAMAELTPEAYEAAAHELIPLQRAMLVLVSDTCVVPELEEMDLENEQGAMDRSQQVEDQMTDTIDELFEEAATDSEGGTQASLMQSSQSLLARITAWVSAIFFVILAGLACTVPGWFVGAFIGIMIASLYCSAVSGVCQGGSAVVIMSAVAGVPIGFATCSALMIAEIGRRA